MSPKKKNKAPKVPVLSEEEKAEMKAERSRVHVALHPSPTCVDPYSPPLDG